MNNKSYFVYIMTNQHNTVLYTGITNNLPQRVYQHKAKIVRGFTKQYNIDKLVYFENFGTPYAAISREKQLKGGSRKQKLDLIQGSNPEFEDLYSRLL